MGGIGGGCRVLDLGFVASFFFFFLGGGGGVVLGFQVEGGL